MALKENSDKKKYLWSFLYLVLVIVGQQLAGIGGIVGAVIISFGIHRTCRNPDLSTTKKWIYSILYTIGGLIVAWIIVILLTGVLAGIFGANSLANVNSDKNIEANYTVEQGFKTYKNSNMEISALQYPADWTVTEDKDNYQVVFESPDKISAITVTLYGLEEGQTINLNTYTADLLKEDQADDSFSFQKTNEQIKKINGKDWLIFDGIMTIPASNYVALERIALFVTGKYEGRQYLNFILETNADNFATESIRFDNVLESVRIYS